jgi:type III secretion system FlhB-like substrate exporter
METKPLSRVVGLRYDADAENSLPSVVLKAAGPVTDALLAQTLHRDGPRLVRDAALLDQLYRLPVDAAIDPALFDLVAALLAHVIAVNEGIRNERGG